MCHLSTKHVGVATAYVTCAPSHHHKAGSRQPLSRLVPQAPERVRVAHGPVNGLHVREADSAQESLPRWSFCG